MTAKTIKAASNLKKSCRFQDATIRIAAKSLLAF
jgi:hypothetical protein